MKKTLVILFLCAFIALQVGAVNVRNLKQIVSQPDGTHLTLFLSGDEYSHRMHDENDYSVMKGKDGYYYYATKAANGNVVSSTWRVGSADPAKLGIPQGLTKPAANLLSRTTGAASLTEYSLSPSVQYNMARGKMNNIVILIDFKDSPGFTKPRSHFESLYNDPDNISLRNYFKESSYGILDVCSGIFPKCKPEELKAYVDVLPKSAYEGMSPASEYDLIIRAIENVRAEIESTYSAEDLDLDRNGNVDCITLMLQGQTSGYETLWPHNSNIINDIYIHGKKVDRYILVFEDWSTERIEDLRVNAHEMFHTFGLPEFYKRSGDIDPVEAYDIMSHGSGHMSAYTKWKYTNGAWIKNIPEITASGRYSLKYLASGPDSVCYKIASPVPGEYVFLEFRKKVGKYEGTLPGSGLIVSRIKQHYWGNMAGVAGGFEMYVFRKDGSPTANGDLYNMHLSKEAGRTTLNATSNPRLFYTIAGSDAIEAQVTSNFEITDISSAAGDRIYFTVNFKVTQKDTVYVKENGTGDGSSWANATGSLDEALAKCTSPAGSEVWIAGGTYTQNTMMNFRERVNVYGSFAGTEKSIGERTMQDQNNNGHLEAWEFAYPTVLKFGSSGGWNTNVTASGFETEWNGLTVNGLDKKIKVESGYVINACVFKNSPNYGTFEFAKWGGTLKNSLLFNNKCGSAPLLNLEAGGLVEGCVLTKNWSYMYPCIRIAVGCINNSLIVNNEEASLSEGGAVPGILFTSLAGIEKSGNNSSGHMQNCTVANNKSDNSTGWIAAERRGKIQLFNTIMWGNLPSEGITPANVNDLRYCAILGYDSTIYAATQVKGNIALSADNNGSESGKSYLRFTNPTQKAGCEFTGKPGNLDGWYGYDWTLKEGSDGIDAGSNQWVAEENNKDLKGTPRIMHGRADIGVYEFEQKLPGTINFTVLEKTYTGTPLMPEYETDPADIKGELSFKDSAEAPVNSGDYNVTVTITDPLYEGSASGIFKIKKADQEITWEQELTDLTQNQTTLLATASSGLPVRYESSDNSVASIEGNLLKLKKSGNCAITALQDGDENRNAAPRVIKQISVKLTPDNLKAVDLVIADGSHSTLFKILDTESLDNSRLLFYNSQGKMIHEQRNYANDYDMGNLAPGTYYYVLTWRDNDGVEQVKKGFVEIIK